MILTCKGEPERAPHLMMSTAVYMFVCCHRTANICLRTSYGYEWLQVHSDNYQRSTHFLDSCDTDGPSEMLRSSSYSKSLATSYMACASPR